MFNNKQIFFIKLHTFNETLIQTFYLNGNFKSQFLTLRIQTSFSRIQIVLLLILDFLRITFLLVLHSETGVYCICIVTKLIIQYYENNHSKDYSFFTNIPFSAA